VNELYKAEKFFNLKLS